MSESNVIAPNVLCTIDLEAGCPTNYIITNERPFYSFLRTIEKMTRFTLKLLSCLFLSTRVLAMGTGFIAGGLLAYLVTTLILEHCGYLRQKSKATRIVLVVAFMVCAFDWMTVHLRARIRNTSEGSLGV